MRSKFDERLDNLNDELIAMGSKVTRAIEDSITALINEDLNLAKSVAHGDDIINDMEKEIETDAIKLLLKHQPVASDLRFITSILKIITDLERIGDQAADISVLNLKLSKRNYTPSDLGSIKAMGDLTVSMVEDALVAYKTGDLDLVEDVILRDQKVNDYFKIVRDEVVKDISDNDFDTKNSLDIFMIAKYLERIGDHAKNVGEWVYYSIAGKHKND